MKEIQTDRRGRESERDDSEKKRERERGSDGRKEEGMGWNKEILETES